MSPPASRPGVVPSASSSSPRSPSPSVPGTDHAAVDAALERLGADGRAEPIEMPPVGISSSLIRKRVGEGRPIRWMVPDPVAALIAERGLYAADTAPAAVAPEVATG